MVQDAKKLRPGVVGGVKGKYALMSEECGLDSVIPKRDQGKGYLPDEIRHGNHQASGRGGEGMEPASRLDHNHQLSLREFPYIIRWRDDRCKTLRQMHRSLSGKGD